MIELKKVNKSYGAQKVLDDITVTLERGRVHGFVGRNGSGKTILMKCIAGLARPDSGEVLVDGRHIGTELENPPDMGAIIEVPGFLPNASGYKNLKYLADISGRAGDRRSAPPWRSAASIRTAASGCPSTASACASASASPRRSWKIPRCSSSMSR